MLSISVLAPVVLWRRAIALVVGVVVAVGLTHGGDWGRSVGGEGKGGLKVLMQGGEQDQASGHGRGRMRGEREFLDKAGRRFV